MTTTRQDTSPATATSVETDEWNDPTGYVSSYPALRRTLCTIRTTNGGQFSGRVSTQGSTYALDVELGNGRWVVIMSHRVKEIRIDEGEHKTA